MKAEVFRDLLREAKYDKDGIELLYNGFSKGFKIGYKGDINAKILSNNLRFDGIGNNTMVWNKVMKEVKSLIFAGPF